MKELTELSKDEILMINGGASFAYRVGQACAIIFDLCDFTTPGISSPAGATAFYDWFY